jgi:hypothetical protein
MATSHGIYPVKMMHPLSLGNADDVADINVLALDTLPPIGCQLPEHLRVHFLVPSVSLKVVVRLSDQGNRQRKHQRRKSREYQSCAENRMQLQQDYY